MIRHFFLASSVLITALCRRFLPFCRILALCGSLALSTFDASGQNCECPPAATCSPCAGGITKLTLRFNGIAGFVTATDAGGIVFAGFLNNGLTFSFTGSDPTEKFQGTNVYMTVIGAQDATIPTACGTYPSNTYGSFTVVGLESKGGGVVCCLPGTTDNIKPIFSNCPQPFTVNLPANSCSTPVTWNNPTASDNCSLASITSVPSSGSVFQLGSTPVLYSATDTYGNTNTCSFTVTVTDNTPPVISSPPANMTVSASTNCQAQVSWTVPTVSDNCTATLSSTRNPQDLFPLGMTPVTYTATDGSGNKSTYTFNVTVEDKVKPVISNCPTNLSATANESCQAVVSWQAPNVTDNCSATLTSSHSPQNTFPIGETIVTYTAADPSGNKTTCTFTVTVINAASPVVKGCPATITVNATSIDKDSTAVTWVEPVATVLCGEVTVSKSHEPGSNFPIGTTKVMYEFTEESGKSSTCEFDIIVLESDALFGISKVLTPDGDGINDIWMLSNIESFKGNNVVVVDRWGNKVYSATGYDNVRIFWNGTNNNGSVVPTGTYFYTIEVRHQDKIVRKKGFLEVIQ